MQISCPRESLLTALQIVGTAVPARTTKPILSNVKAMTGHDGSTTDSMTLMATDLDVGIRYDLRGVKVSRPGVAILPVTRLVSILKETADEEITLNVGADSTVVKLSGSRFELPGGNAHEFPELPGFPDGEVGYHEISAGVLRTMIRRVEFAVEKRESTRFAVTGILWEVDAGADAGAAFQGRCRLVATDTRRLALAEGPATVSAGATSDPSSATPSASQTHLIPIKAVKLLERNLTDDGELVRVVLRPNEALFQTERAMIHTRLVEGRFPPYRTIIPGGWGQTPSAGRQPLVKLPIAVGPFTTGVRQVSVMTDQENSRVDFAFAPEQVTLTARGTQTGSGEVVVPLPEYQGPEIAIAFAPNYLLDMLRAIDGEPTAILEMTDGVKPAVFKVGDSYLYLVMPLAG